VVGALLKGDIQAERLLATNPVQARSIIEAELAALGVKKVKDNSLSRAMARTEYTNDPLELSVLSQASRAEAAHLIKRLPASLAGLYDLGPLNQLLRAAGEPAVPG
jgi:NitT/TauT family transport system substrate-binding protein